MNSLPNAGAHLGNIFVGVVRVCMAIVEPLDHACPFATGGVKGEEAMTIIISGMIHLGLVGVVTQIIAFEPLRRITAIFFNLAVIHSTNREAVGYCCMGNTVFGGLKVVEGVIWISSEIVPFNPWNYLLCAFQVQAMTNL
jgi:hypothetical protein